VGLCARCMGGLWVHLCVGLWHDLPLLITRQTLGCGRLHIVQIIPNLQLLSSVSAGFACLFVLLCLILERLRVSGRGFQSVAKRRLSSANFAKEFDDWVMLYPFEDAQNNWVSYRGKSLETC